VPQPIERVVIERLLNLKPGELTTILQALQVPSEVQLARLYDLAVFLTEYFASEHLYGLMRRPWHYSQQQCPAQSFLHSILDCLQDGRPDLIEHPA